MLGLMTKVQTRMTDLKEMLQDNSGATAIEYGLIAALISVAAIVAMTAIGGSLDTLFTTVSDELDTAVGS